MHRFNSLLAQMVERIPRFTSRHGSSRRTAPAGDFVTACVFAMLLVTITMASVIGRASMPRVGGHRGDPQRGRMRFERSSSLEEPSVRCVGAVRPAPRTQPCSPAERKMWVWSAPNRVREAMGKKPCWWHASAHDLMSISGITEEYAERAVALRDRKDGLRFPGELLDELGAHRAELLAHHTSVQCAVDAWDNGL